jgi:hypothetical protein
MRLSVVVDIAGLERPAYVADWWILYRPSGQLDLTPPDTTLPDLTLPDTTLPDTTLPDTTLPDTTLLGSDT